MARLARFELTTFAFGGRHSIQLSYKRTAFLRASSILTNARAWRGCSGPHVPSSLTGPSLRTSFTCAHRTHDLRSSRATLYPAELQAHCLFARLKHSYECTRLARLLGASRPLVPDGTVLADVVHLRSPNSRPSLIKGDTLSCLSYKRTVFSRASSILANARAWRGCSGPHVPSSLTGPSLRTSFTCAHRTHDLRSSRATRYRA